MTKTKKRDSEMDTKAGGEACTSQSQSSHKKGYMTIIYLTDSGKDAIVDFVQDHKD